MQDDIVSSALTSRILSSKSPDHVATYKTELQKIIKKNNVVKSINNINIKIKNKTLQPIDMIMINALDNTITKGILQAEKKILKTRLTQPWSPTPVVDILTLSLWKVKLSALRNHRDNSNVVTKIPKKIKTFPGQPIPIQTDSNESKTIYSNFYDAKKYLKNT